METGRYTVCYNNAAVWVRGRNAVRDANIGSVAMRKTKWQDAEGLCVDNAFSCKYGECLSPGKKMMDLRSKEISYAKVREVWYIWRKAFLVLDKTGLGNGRCMQSKPCQQWEGWRQTVCLYRTLGCSHQSLRCSHQSLGCSHQSLGCLHQALRCSSDSRMSL